MTKANIRLLATLIPILAGMSPLIAAADYAYAPPAVHDDGWPTASLAEVGMNTEAVARLTGQLEGERFEGIHSYLIVKDGKLVHEAYFRGFHRERRQQIFSITKSVTAVLVGIAMAEGEFPALDTTLPALLPRQA